MFQKKQYIYSEDLGICKVENIVSLSATKGAEAVPYYALKSLYNEKTAYIPVDNHQTVLREIFTRDEAVALQNQEETNKNPMLKHAIEFVLSEEK